MNNIIQNALLDIFYGYEEYVFYNKKEYIDAFNYASKLLSTCDNSHPYYPIVKSWKIHLDHTKSLVNTLHIHLTNNCQLKCKHCYLPQNTNPKPITYLSLNDIKTIANKFVYCYDYFKEENNPINVVLGGGECTLHPEFKEILLYSLQKFNRVKILSNLINLPKDILDILIDHKHKVEIQTSIDGVEKTHDSIRGKGTYSKTSKNIKILLDNNVNISILFIAHDNNNYKEFEEVYKTFNKLGVNDISCDRITPLNTKFKSLSESDLNNFLKLGNKYRGTRTRLFFDFTKEFCDIGHMFTVNSNGYLQICNKLPDTLINVITSPVEDIIKTIKYSRLKYRIVPKECLDCKDAHFCIGGSKCITYAEHGNFYTKDKICNVKNNMLPSYKDVFYLMRLDKTQLQFYKYANCILDRFGFFESPQIHPLPEYNDSTLYKETSKRIKQLGEKNILWSGGIDSTYIICSYVKEKIPFNVICDNSSINYNYEFYKWMVKNNINIIHFDNIHSAFNIKNLVSGYLADTLFAYNLDRIYQIKENISFYDSMKDFSNRDELYEQIINYGKLLKKPTDTTYEIIRLLNFGLEYIHSCNEIKYTLFPKYPVITFFNTKYFSDLSWSKYWYQTSLDGKPEMKTLICDITENENFMLLEKNPNNITPRIPFKNNILLDYISPTLDYV